MSKSLEINEMDRRQSRLRATGENRYPRRRANFLPPVLGIGHRLVAIALLAFVLAGCAVQSDRTRELLELDLADRGRAMDQLERDFHTEPAAWQAYSLGVLHGAEGQYDQMNRWFERCTEMTDLYDQKIIRIRSEHWRDEAKKADAAFAAQDWQGAADACKQALLIAPEHTGTWHRLVEARIMAWGPELEEIRTLVAADRKAVLDRWLEDLGAGLADQTERRQRRETAVEVRVRLQAQLEAAHAAGKMHTGDAEATFILAELCRLTGDWPAMDRWYRRYGELGRDDAGGNAALADAGQRTGVIVQNRRETAAHFLANALTAWGGGRAGRALACLDTADIVDPGRADIVGARRKIEMLAAAGTPAAVRSALSTGDVGERWLVLWMTQLQDRGRHEEAALVADALLGAGDYGPATSDQQQALRLRAAWRIETQDLPGAAADLRRLLSAGVEDPQAAVVLGDVLVATSYYAEAHHWYARAAEWGGTNAGLERRRARTAFCQGDFAGMLIHAEWAVAADPVDPQNQRLLVEARQLTAEVQP